MGDGDGWSAYKIQFTGHPIQLGQLFLVNSKSFNFSKAIYTFVDTQYILRNLPMRKSQEAMKSTLFVLFILFHGTISSLSSTSSQSWKEAFLSATTSRGAEEHLRYYTSLPHSAGVLHRTLVLTIDQAQEPPMIIKRQCERTRSS